MFIYKKNRTEKFVAEEVCNKLFSGFLISESAEDKELKKELKDKLAKIKTPEDLKKFMEDNADQIKDSYKKADKKSKPIYKKAWDGLCKAVSGTTGFMLDHIGGVLTLAGVLLVGHKIGWKNIYSFIKTALTGHDPEESHHAAQTMSKISDVRTQSIEAVRMVHDAVKKGTLSKEQAQKIWNIRQWLPNEVNADADSSGGIVDWVVSTVNPDRALRMTASRAKEIQDVTDVAFMAGLGEVMKKCPGDSKKVDEYLDLFGPGKILGNNLKKASFAIPGKGGQKY